MYRISELVRLDRKLVHSNDLAVLWGISSKNTLYTAIKRYVKRGILIPIYNGLYSTVPILQLDPRELGVAIIHKFAYLSTESVLVQDGIIYQGTYGNTFVTSVSEKITIGEISFIYRKMKDQYLNNRSGLTEVSNIFVASTERAVADMLYFNPSYHFDVPDNIDWEKVNTIQREVGYL